MDIMCISVQCATSKKYKRMAVTFFFFTRNSGAVTADFVTSKTNGCFCLVVYMNISQLWQIFDESIHFHTFIRL